jgi:hypothetical protein
VPFAQSPRQRLPAGAIGGHRSSVPSMLSPIRNFQAAARDLAPRFAQERSYVDESKENHLFTLLFVRRSRPQRMLLQRRPLGPVAVPTSRKAYPQGSSKPTCKGVYCPQRRFAHRQMQVRRSA